MKVSLELHGCYWEHKIFFDEMAKGMQKQGHQVGVITGERETDPFSGKDNRAEILKNLGFKPDFLYLWGHNETIANGNLWIVERMIKEDVYLHFSPNARELKKYTDRWVVKTLDSGQMRKF